MKFVFNASPLIHLVKAGLSSLVERLDGEKYTVPAVFHEVVEVGKALRYPDALTTEEIIKRKIITVRNPSATILQVIIRTHKDVHKGEAEVIALTKEINAVAIVDDSVARAIARIHDVRVEGAYGIILRALVKGHISKDEAEDSLQKLVSSGWRCDVELYNKLIKLIREVA